MQWLGDFLQPKDISALGGSIASSLWIMLCRALERQLETEAPAHSTYAETLKQAIVRSKAGIEWACIVSLLLSSSDQVHVVLFRKRGTRQNILLAQGPQSRRFATSLYCCLLRLTTLLLRGTASFCTTDFTAPFDLCHGCHLVYRLSFPLHSMFARRSNLF